MTTEQTGEGVENTELNALVDTATGGGENQVLDPAAGDLGLAAVTEAGGEGGVIEEATELLEEAEVVNQAEQEIPVVETATKEDEATPDEPAPVALQPVEPHPAVAAVKEEETFYNDVERVAILKMREYEVKMAAGRPVTPESISSNQISLYRNVMSVINADSATFESAFPKVLSIIDADSSGAFNDRRIFRGMDNVALPERDRLAFPRIFSMLKLIANPATRSIALSQVDVRRSMEYGVTGQGAQNIANFLSI